MPLAPNVVGALWMVLSAAGFGFQSALVKYTGGRYSPMMQAFILQAVAFVILLPVVWRMGPRAYRTSQPFTMVMRAAGSIVGLLLSFYAFQNMPLVAANALGFTRALWLAPLAVIFLGEKVGPLRVATVVIGFGGVLVMLGPDLAQGIELGLPALAMLASALVLAAVVLSLKRLTRGNSATVLLVWATGLGTLLTLPGALLTWRWPDPVDLGLLCVTGVIVLVAQAAYYKSMSIGDASAMAPIDYSRLIFAAGLAYLLFGEIPTFWVVAGASVVVGSTLFMTLREQQLAQREMLRAAEASGP